jgi:hypothetical protein
MVGSFMGMVTTGNTFTIPAVQICRFAQGKLVEMWGFRSRRYSCRLRAFSCTLTSAHRAAA